MTVLLLAEWQKNRLGLHLSPTWGAGVAETEYNHEQSHFYETFYKTLLQYTFHLTEQALNCFFIFMSAELK